MKIDGKIAIITGAASGIGRATAIDLAKHNCILAINDINEEGLEKTFKEVKKYSPQSMYKICDVTQTAQIKDFCTAVFDKYGHIDLLLNIAGIGQGGLVEDSTLEDVYRDNDVCFYGATRFIYEVLPIMLRQQSGAIINMSSVAAIIHAPFMSAYTSTKCAALGYTECLYQELKNRNIYVCVLLPGFIKSEMWDKIDFNRLKVPENVLDQVKSLLKSSYPLMTSTEEAAAIIRKRAIEKEAPKVIVTKYLSERVFYKICEISPGMIRKIMSLSWSLTLRKGEVIAPFIGLFTKLIGRLVAD